MAGEPDGAPGQGDEDLLRYFLREDGVVKLTEGRTVNEGQVAFDECSELCIRALRDVALEQLGICQVACHSIIVFPPEAESRK
jgi:hypothetical protein